MSLFHSLRSTRWLVRLMLLWFALTLSATVASPASHPQGEQVICSGMGMQNVLIDEDGTVTTSAVSGISCPLCLMGGAPPQTTLLLLAAARVPCKLVSSKPSARIATFTATPPPARGPPRA